MPFIPEDLIVASYQGIAFDISEVRVSNVTGSDDNSHSVTYFEGRMMTFHFPNKLVNSVSIFSRGFNYRDISRKDEKQAKVELESIEFNNAFDVYSQNEQDAFYLITPQLMERLLLLAGKYESIAVNVVGNRVVIAFNEPGKNVFDAEIEVGKLDLDKEMSKVQAEIDDIKILITQFLNPRTYA